MATESCLDKAQRFWAGRMQNSGFCKPFGNVNIIDATGSRITAELTVTIEMAHSRGSLHGGAIATIIDIVSSVGLQASCERSSVSVSLNTNYLRMAKVGDKIIVESEITKQGKTMAFLDIKLKSREDGQVIATGSHVKCFS